MSRPPSRVLSLVAVLALAFPAAALAKVKVGFVNSTTGPEAPIAEAISNGVNLALEDLAKQGVEIELVRQDDTGKPTVAMSAMEQLATGDEVVAVVGPYTSACANAMAKLAQTYKVPLLIPVASKEDITRQGYQWVFRLNAPVHNYSQQLIDMVTTLGTAKSIAFIYESTDFGTSAATMGKEYAIKKGLTVLADEAYQKGAPDYRSTLTKLKSLKPDLLFMVSYVADAVLIMRQARELGLTPLAFLGGGAGFDTTQFESEKDISTSVFSVTQWTKDTGWPGAAEFNARYQARYGKRPTYHAATGYASMMIMGDTVAKAGGDRKKVREALAAGSWKSIMGDVKFVTSDGFTNQNFVIMPVIQYQAGKAETVYPPQFAKTKAVFPFPGWK
jgi:branched-chain amino acid transport system substrate-binding protein